MGTKFALGVVRARVFGKAAPLAVGFELTHRCNLHCSYCDRHTKLPNEMSREQILGALAGLVETGMQALSFDGGEPLLHENFDEIVRWLVSHRVLIRLNTNGALIPRHDQAVRSMAKVKISLDGPDHIHDAARGPRAFERAVQGARAARDLGVAVEFTCVVGPHNAAHVRELLDVVRGMALGIVFQPVRESLMSMHASSTADADRVLAAFREIEELKRGGAPVLNRWSSLRHLRAWPNDQALPCAAGWINATLDPEGNLYACGQFGRSGPKTNVVELGAQEAFARLVRQGCRQCWCARVVEENYAWGGRLDMNLPPANIGRRAGSRLRLSQCSPSQELA
jgi:MoaA/NifB/PqqE/SkfB family radical SAM enzyme